MSYTAFIALGSNLGNRQKNCERAIEILGGRHQTQVSKTSKWYSTKALTLNGEDQPDYVNGACQIETTLSLKELFKVCKDIEKELGRKLSAQKWQPRIIDLDILFYEDRVVETPELKIPHPHLHEREFVLRPLNDIAPDWIHPLLKNTVAQMLENVLKSSR